ncbi:hypothetical protein LSH36_651g01021 [Paralvinella palmiformis]|uniref:Uncharacterized protein n=1 Tax=Paralvinella palmiformis TaxID=53620 RepID=A0AAD9J3S4_9ANNE|nr:hypothetical protein LSH36_651g01021 [Paralvinella palmiformis]
MAVPRINIKNIDYFKFKKLVIDGARDDYNSCSKEVKALCDCVQTLNFRDEEFDDVTDRARFSEICAYYRQIMASKRIEATDMRIKSGWWGDHKNAYSAGKIKASILKDLLLKKSKEWTERHGGLLEKVSDTELQNKIEGRGLYVLKHKDHQCFQYVGRADKIFARFSEKLRAAFESNLEEPLAALVVISMATDWDFYFIPVSTNDDDRVLRILENDLILKHDSIWPHGLNFRLHIDSLIEVSEFRKSCLRHHWPPESETVEGNFLNLGKLRDQIATLPPSPVEATPPPTPKGKKAKVKPNMLPPPSPPPFCFGDIEMDVSPPEPEDDPERPGSGMSNATYVVSTVRQSPTYSESTLVKTPPPIRKPIPIRATPRPTSGGKRSAAAPRPIERPMSGKTPVRPTSARERPTTPRRGKPGQGQTPRRPLSGSPEPGYDATWVDDEDPGSVSQDESTGSMDRSHSTTSLSSTDGRHPVSPEHANRKSPAPRGGKPVARPTTLFKNKQDRSRLPMATPRRSTRN